MKERKEMKKRKGMEKRGSLSGVGLPASATQLGVTVGNERIGYGAMQPILLAKSADEKWSQQVTIEKLDKHFLINIGCQNYIVHNQREFWSALRTLFKKMGLEKSIGMPK